MSFAGLFNIFAGLVVVAGIATLVGSQYTGGIVNNLLNGTANVFKAAESGGR